MSNDKRKDSIVKRPMIFGEILFDHFPDGSRVMGGAPLNVAWGLRGLGFDPLLVSAVGNDAEGDLVRERMDAWGMDLGGLQQCQQWSTGSVQIEIENNEPSYNFEPDQAYDHIDDPDVGNDFAVLYHGSLVRRGEASRKTLQRMIDSGEFLRFVDLNIRRPHFDASDVPAILGGATWIKINEIELAEISGLPTKELSGIQAAVESLRQEHGDATYFVTRGSDGAIVIDADQVHKLPAPASPDTFCDSVGAGDAFTAATIGGLLMGKPSVEILHDAVRFAARICGIQGATTEDVSVYQGIVG